MNNVAHPDHRKFHRYELIDYALAVSCQHPSGIRVVVSDVGLGGLSLRSKEKMLVGENLEIHLASSHGGEQVLRAVVRHSSLVHESDLYATGVQFTPETHEERLNIANFVNEAFLRLCEANAN